MDWWEYEELISLATVGQELRPRRSATTVWRWVTKGVRGVRLQAKRVGGRLYTSREAVARFEAALSERLETTPAAELPARVAAASRNGVTTERRIDADSAARADAAGRQLARCHARGPWRR